MRGVASLSLVDPVKDGLRAWGRHYHYKHYREQSKHEAGDGARG
jgi:hypothetical protein